jgi:hypothetical protein
VSPEFALCFALLPMVSSPFASPWGVGILEHFVSVVLSRCPRLRGPRLALSSDLVLPFFVWSLIWVLCSFLFFFFLLWIGNYVCCQCTHEGGDWGQERPRTSGRSLVWGVIDNVLWTDSW